MCKNTRFGLFTFFGQWKLFSNFFYFFFHSSKFFIPIKGPEGHTDNAATHTLIIKTHSIEQFNQNEITLQNCGIIMSPKRSLGNILCLLRFFLLLLFFLSFFLCFFLSSFRQKFIQHISRRPLNGNQRNFTGMLSTMSRCADYFRNFKNGCRCHGNGQNAKKMKNTKMIIEGYSLNKNWWNLIGTTSTSSGTR